MFSISDKPSHPLKTGVFCTLFIDIVFSTKGSIIFGVTIFWFESTIGVLSLIGLIIVSITASVLLIILGSTTVLTICFFTTSFTFFSTFLTTIGRENVNTVSIELSKGIGTSAIFFSVSYSNEIKTINKVSTKPN